MMTDLIAAAAHHLLAFSVFGLLIAELLLLRSDLTAERVRRLARLDAHYGVAAMSLIVVGAIRVYWGARGAEFYLGNLVFWTKMAAFLAVGILSAIPTRQIIRWRRAAGASPGYAPPVAEVAAVRRYVVAETAVFPVILLAAAALGRGFGA